MILGIGTDIADIKRLEDALRQHGTRFRDRVFTAQEVLYCEPKPRSVQHYAGRFAAKEAAFKALGTGWAKGLSWHDVEVFPGQNGPPVIQFHGLALEFFSDRGGKFVHLSISHTDLYAVAFVVLES